MLQHDHVESVEEDRVFHSGGVSISRPVHSWGLDSIDGSPNDARYALPCNVTGAGVDVYVVDTGVRYSHAEFSGRAQFPQCDPVDELEGEAHRGGDCANHGTHIAGTIGGRRSGVAPGVDLFSVRVVNCRGIGSAVTILQGLECVLNRTRSRTRPSVVNLSIFGERIRAIKRAVERLIRLGVTVVGIAGNTRRNSKPRDACRLSPASIHGVLSVSASTLDNVTYELSNAGTCVDVYAPGKGIRSSSSACDQCFSTRSGSSMAAPHVTGAAALLLERCPLMPPWKVRHTILSRLTRVDALDLSQVPKRLRKSTPNLSLSFSDELCSVQC